MGGNGQSRNRQLRELESTHSNVVDFNDEANGLVWESAAVSFKAWQPRLIGVLDFNFFLNSEGKIFGHEDMVLGEHLLARDYTGRLERNEIQIRCSYGDGTVGVFSGTILQHRDSKTKLRIVSFQHRTEFVGPFLSAHAGQLFKVGSDFKIYVDEPATVVIHYQPPDELREPKNLRLCFSFMWLFLRERGLFEDKLFMDLRLTCKWVEESFRETLTFRPLFDYEAIRLHTESFTGYYQIITEAAPYSHAPEHFEEETLFLTLLSSGAYLLQKVTTRRKKGAAEFESREIEAAFSVGNDQENRMKASQVWRAYGQWRVFNRREDRGGPIANFGTLELSSLGVSNVRTGTLQMNSRGIVRITEKQLAKAIQQRLSASQATERRKVANKVACYSAAIAVTPVVIGLSPIWIPTLCGLIMLNGGFVD